MKQLTQQVTALQRRINDESDRTGADITDPGVRAIWNETRLLAAQVQKLTATGAIDLPAAADTLALDARIAVAQKAAVAAMDKNNKDQLLRVLKDVTDAAQKADEGQRATIAQLQLQHDSLQKAIKTKDIQIRVLKLENPKPKTAAPEPTVTQGADAVAKPAGTDAVNAAVLERARKQAEATALELRHQVRAAGIKAASDEELIDTLIENNKVLSINNENLITENKLLRQQINQAETAKNGSGPSR